MSALEFLGIFLKILHDNLVAILLLFVVSVLWKIYIVIDSIRFTIQASGRDLLAIENHVSKIDDQVLEAATGIAEITDLLASEQLAREISVRDHA